PLQYAAEQIAGNDAVVTSIYPPGVDAHTYEPATKEITEIAELNLFLYLGADMESFADSIKSDIYSKAIKFLNMETTNPNMFNENFKVFADDMQELDNAFHNTLDDKENKTLLVTHAAYGYWESAYGIEQIAISGISSSDEPSQKELTKIAEIAKENDLQYVVF